MRVWINALLKNKMAGEGECLVIHLVYFWGYISYIYFLGWSVGCSVASHESHFIYYAQLLSIFYIL